MLLIKTNYCHILGNAEGNESNPWWVTVAIVDCTCIRTLDIVLLGSTSLAKPSIFMAIEHHRIRQEAWRPILWRSVKLFITNQCFTTTTRNTQNSSTIDCSIERMVKLEVIYLHDSVIWGLHVYKLLEPSSGWANCVVTEGDHDFMEGRADCIMFLKSSLARFWHSLRLERCFTCKVHVTKEEEQKFALCVLLKHRFQMVVQHKEITSYSIWSSL